MNFIFGKNLLDYWKPYKEDRAKHAAILENHHRWYELTSEEQQEVYMKKLHFIHQNLDFKKYFTEYDCGAAPLYTKWEYIYQGLAPGFGLNYSMFGYSIAKLASDEQ